MRIAIATQKGGTGKTTSSISISAVLGRKGERVLLIDLDSQANIKTSQKAKFLASYTYIYLLSLLYLIG